jgi:putative membrane protein
VKNRSFPILAFAGLSLALAPACKRTDPDAGSTRTTAATEPSSGVSAEDRDFMIAAAKGGLAEVAFGKEISLSGKNVSPSVKAFGDRMMIDHRKADAELNQLAAKKGVTMPTELDAEAQATLTKLSNLNGPELDKEYAYAMIDDHEKDVKAFRNASQNAKDPELRDWAAKMVPVIESHLAQARDMEMKTKTTR